MRDRSKFIVMIVTVLIVIVITLVCGGQRALVTASSTPGPSQFYLQQNLISDGFVPVDLIHSNLVNAWGLVSGPTTPWWIANTGPAQPPYTTSPAERS